MADLNTCPDAAGSVNNGGLPDIQAYTPPVDLCESTYSMLDCGDDKWQEQIAIENLNISGAPLNIFKLLGNHEQGKLIDLVGNGEALNGSSAIFDSLSPNWISTQTGLDVLTTPSWVGYDFGVVKTESGADRNGPQVGAMQHITSIKITQPTVGRRALQIKIENSDGGYTSELPTITGTGIATISDFSQGPHSKSGVFTLAFNSATSASVFYTSTTTEVIGILTVGQRFNSVYGSFTITPTVPFQAGDLLTFAVSLKWMRVDIVNVADSETTQLLRIKQSKPSRYWRIVPTSFSGAMTNQPWEISKLELFDYQATRLDDIQDTFLLENRDRDYAKQSVQLKVAYQPTDSISDLSKFGFSISESFTFTSSFAQMVKILGRPIVVGDVLELPSEMQYDHNLKPIRKFLEVSDTSWAADGYTANWRPIMYRFQASQLIPSQEHRDILGTADTQKFLVDDGQFFNGIEQIQTAPLTTSIKNAAEAAMEVPEKGTDILDIASGMNRFNTPGSYDGVGLYVEDGLPPDNLPYTEGYKLPDVAGVSDNAFFRLNYDPKLNIPARLYKFSSIKNKWIFVETDRRSVTNAMKPSQLQVMSQPNVMPLSSKDLP